MKESDNKKYFVKDVSLYSTDEDMFNYSDIAEVLNKIIVTNSPPYNVAVIGKWGLGKSSLINLVTGKYRKKNNQNQYLVQEINAWKYEKESLRKVFLKQLWQGISEQKVQSFEVIKKELSNIINADVASMPENRKEGRTKKFLVTVGVISAFTIVIFAIYKIIQACVLNISVWSLDFWLRAFLSYCKNIGTILFIPVIVALLKLLLDDYHAKQTKKIELSFPIETTDDYEIFLETKIRERLAEYPELKIITVIDDLDRLSIDKIVEALDALKAFVGFERCIFIVPFDDEIIKQALNKRRAKFFNDQADVIESELILDKLFQFKIYLPPVLEFDIHQYAFALLKQETPDFLKDYCNESIMKKVIDRVLIHQSVTTPRQVKKLLNAFINNYMIVSARESSGKIEKGLLTSEDSIMQIAKISVLQADFNSFYDLLFKDMSCIDTILLAHERKRDVSSLPAYLGDYFEKKTSKMGEEIYLLKSENESLVNFLIKTEKYRVSSIAPFLYLAQDGMSIMFGDELQRRAVNALKSGNIKTVEALFDETENIAKILEYHLYMENDSIEEILKVAIAVFDKIQEQYRNPIAQNIINRTLELRQNEKKALYGVSAANAFLIASYGENKVFNSEFIEIYIEILSNEHWLNKEVLLNELKIVLGHYSELDQSTKNTLKKVTELCMAWDNDISASDLFDCVEVTEDGFVFLWGVSWYEILCEYIDTENDFSSEIIWHLKNALVQLKESVELDTLIPSLLKLLGYSELLVVIAEILDLSVEQVGGISIKKTISKDNATKIAEEVIKHDIEEYGEQISRILLELPYQIDEENSGVFDNFTQNCIQTDVFDETVVYCGENQYYRFLPKTISELIKAAVADDTNDILLAKSIVYFTNEVV